MTAAPTRIDEWPAHLMIEAQKADLSHRFPGVIVWFGYTTRHWWAMLATAGTWRLIEAPGPHDLSQLIHSLRASAPDPERRPPRRRHVRAALKRPNPAS